ncbi:tetratricopeptide repeat protein [Kocuria rosea]|uniref:Tetratricopeptide repeat protein n=1 Tax=Kocuria rosea TaxID=1275 RepID=A0A4V3B1M2_KOCRO|nr:tetratricopeptide repeat protein [Kocuria rosea]TDL37478.1 tetratricopeptide repeat protein [Kocuria rosea]
MGFDRARVVQIWSPTSPNQGSSAGSAGGGNSGVGSGYRVSADLVLTAAHVVAGHTVRDPSSALSPSIAAPGGAGIEVAVLQTAIWTPAVVVWRDEDADVALLRAPDLPALPAGSPIPPWGKVTGHEQIECMAVGFPWAVVAPHQLRDTEQMVGFIPPLSGAVTGTQAITVRSSPPLPRNDRGSPWAGMSGAAVFTGRYLVGVIVVDPSRYGTDRLRATPLASLLEINAHLRGLLGAEVGVEPVRLPLPLAISAQDSMGLRPPYRPLRGTAPTRSPGALLQAQHGMVPFADRSDQLADLQAWCQQQGTLALRVVTGDGGAGKTRLAAELCVVMAARGWDTGFAEFNPPGKEHVDDYDRATLVVVDDADQHVDLLEKLLSTLDYRPHGAVPVRLLLLARNLQGWWAQLNVQTERVPEEIADPVLQLTDGELGQEERAHQFHAAYAVWQQFREPPSSAGSSSAGAAPRAADAPQGPGPLQAQRETTPNLSDSAFSNPLLVHMTALLAVFPALLPTPSTTSKPGGTVSRDEGEICREAIRDGGVRERILDRVLSHEEARWQKSPGRPLQADGTPDALTVRQAVALVTLIAPFDRAFTEHHLAAVPRLGETDRLDRARIGDWLRQLYPGAEPPWVAPLRPDLLAEQLLATTDGLLDIADNALDRLLDTDSTGAISQLLGELVRAGHRFPVCQTLDHLLEAHLPRLIDHAMGDPTGQIATQLDRALLLSPQPHQAVDQMDRLPGRGIILAPLALTLTDQAIEHLRARAASQHERFTSTFVIALSNRSVRLQNLGRREDALATSVEAVRICRELTDTGTDVTAAELAYCLTHAASHMGSLGQRQKALEAIEEAVRIYREMASTDPDKVKPDLALSLTSLAWHQGNLGWRQKALETVEDAVSIYRELASTDASLFMASLAQSLGNLAAQQGELGRRQAAMETVEEAVGIHRELAMMNPDHFKPDFARSLANFSNHLLNMGRRQEALDAVEEAVSIYRELVAIRPEVFMPDLAGALNGLSIQIGALGRRQEALDAIEEAVEIFRQLMTIRPEAFSHDMAMALTNLSTDLTQLGQHERSLAASMEAVEIFRGLVTSYPDAFVPDLASTLSNLSVQLANLGRNEEALVAGCEAVELRRDLATAHPEAFTADLADSIANLSNRLGEVGRHDDALATGREAVGLRRDLAAAYPDVFSPRLALSLTNVSILLGDMGRQEEALPVAQEAVEIYRELDSTYPGTFTPDLARALNSLSAQLGRSDRHEESLPLVEEAVDIYRILNVIYPSAFITDLSNAVNNLSIELAHLGRHEEARTASEEADRLTTY